MSGPHERHPRARQRGVGLVEVLIALAILVFGALVTAHMQVGALTGLRITDFHLALDRLSTEMIETLRTHEEAAAAGLFDHDSANAPEPSTEEVEPAEGASSETPSEEATEETATEATSTEPLSRTEQMTADWRARVVDAIPTAETRIDCEAGFCNVEITWMEEIDGTFRRQSFETRTPL